MLGRHHLVLTTLTAAGAIPILVPDYPIGAALAVLGASIGSLVPDSDTRGSTVFHTSVKGGGGRAMQAFNTLVAPSLPVFGYVTRYLIYIPVVELFNRTLFRSRNLVEHHRGFLHTWLGIATSTTLMMAYISAAAMLLGVFRPYAVAFFGAGYLFGQFMHLVEDSATKSGIAWNHPFSSHRLSGELVTKTGLEHTWKQKTLAGFLLLGVVLGPVASLAPVEVPAAYLLAPGYVSVCWIIFLAAGARIKLER